MEPDSEPDPIHFEQPDPDNIHNEPNPRPDQKDLEGKGDLKCRLYLAGTCALLQLELKPKPGRLVRSTGKETCRSVREPVCTKEPALLLFSHSLLASNVAIPFRM